MDFWASPRHLGQSIARCLIAHPEGASTADLVAWTYPEPHRRWQLWNVKRHMRAWGYQPIGRVRADRSLIWRLRKLED
jgi:hypothetical protein